MPEARTGRGHGMWPYLLPYLSFGVLVEVASRAPEGAWLAMLALKPALPLALVLWFARRGAYPELRGYRARLWRPAGGLPADVAVGLALAVLWMAPYVALPALRPDDAAGFDPARAGESYAALALALRAFGYVLVTPVFEELFIRSFVMRYAEVFDGRGDFRDVPIGHPSARGFWVSTIFFTIGHQPWEYWVALPWVALSTLWLYRRRHLVAVIVVHAVTNAAVLASAVLQSGRIPDGRGGWLSLWFFV